MISFAIATALSAAPAMQAPLVAPRRNYSSCLSKAVKKSLGEKVDPAAFPAAARTVCAAEEAAFKAALVSFDVKAGIRRAQAERDAETQIEDYLTGAAETYKVHAEAGSKPEE